MKLSLPKISVPKLDVPRIPIPSIGLRPKAPPADPIAETPKVLSELQEAFAARRKEEAARVADATDSEYWVAVCFRSREHKEQFLRALKLIELGDKYIDGHEAAKVLGVELEESKDFRRTKKNRRLEALT